MKQSCKMNTEALTQNLWVGLWQLSLYVLLLRKKDIFVWSLGKPFSKVYRNSTKNIFWISVHLQSTTASNKRKFKA